MKLYDPQKVTPRVQYLDQQRAIQIHELDMLCTRLMSRIAVLETSATTMAAQIADLTARVEVLEAP